MQVRIKLGRTTHGISQWKEAIQKDTDLTVVQDAAHLIREEVFFFNARTRAEAQQIKDKLLKWVEMNFDLAAYEGWKSCAEVTIQRNAK